VKEARVLHELVSKGFVLKKNKNSVKGIFPNSTFDIVPGWGELGYKTHTEVGICNMFHNSCIYQPST